MAKKIGKIKVKGTQYKIDFSQPLDISIPLVSKKLQVNAFYAPLFKIEAVQTEHFIGDTSQGGLVNFKNIFINPHGNGTHTECVGHIAKEPYFLNKCLKEFNFLATLVSIAPEKRENGDFWISLSQFEAICPEITGSAIIIRSLPNLESKLDKQYSAQNPCYIDHLLADHLRKSGVKHLLIDLPSVDREEDEGKLLAHRAFWNYPEKPRKKATITELVYVSDQIKDGIYWLQFQILNIELDASPSRPVLYRILP